MPVLRLAIPKPLRRSYDYLPPVACDPASLRPGTRIKVPFGAGSTVGYLLSVEEHSEYALDKLKTAEAILDDNSLLPPALHQLLLWAARYYCHPVGEVYSSAFPALLRKGKAIPASGIRCWQLSEHGKGLPPGALKRAKKQAAIIALLQEQGVITEARLREQGFSSTLLKTLQNKQLIELCHKAPAHKSLNNTGLDLNSEQHTALEHLNQHSDAFAVHLLEGVTGAGKTEVYLQFIDRCLRQQKQVLVLIPEIGLTPQTLRRFTDRFGQERIATLHSGMTDRERAQIWGAAGRGEIDVILGTRSAIFTPLLRPGAIIVDEEHDGAYKQQDGFRYHARDMAVKRGQLENIPVVLGTATPSLESAANAQRGRYHLLRLTERAGSASMPRMNTVDLRQQALQAGLSTTALQAMKKTLLAGRQVLLFLQRRGFAPSLRCHDCGWIADCYQCDARLTLHQRAQHLRCHHCEARLPIPTSCPQCSKSNLILQGVGTEQAETFLQQQFPDTAIYRVDSDTVSGRDSLNTLLAQINQGQPCILVGTQMLSKGHHFPDVTLVVIHDTDSTLFSADFRGEERLAQLLTQVAGRAGREAHQGEVLLQTHYPQHPAINAILEQDYHRHSQALLAQRKENNLPPFGHLVLFHAEAPQPQQAEEFLLTLKRAVNFPLNGLQMIGPLPSPMQRRAGLFRSQLTLLCNNRAQLKQAMQHLIASAESHRRPSRLRWLVDVDPTDTF